jgi:hypothetical protein
MSSPIEISKKMGAAMKATNYVQNKSHSFHVFLHTLDL